jgi:hypothetical protein
MNVEMSPNAVTLRLKRVSQLRRMGLSLGKALPAGNSAKPTADETSAREPQPPQVKQ